MTNDSENLRETSGLQNSHKRHETHTPGGTIEVGAVFRIRAFHDGCVRAGHEPAPAKAKIVGGSDKGLGSAD